MSQDPTAEVPQEPSDRPAGQAPPPPPYGQSAPPPGPGYPPPPGEPHYGSPYPTPGAPMPSYGGPVYSGIEHPQGTLILILGILSIVVCQLTGPFAWSMGRKAIREIDASGQTYTNRGVVQAGMICGIVGTAFLAIGVLIGIVYLIAIGVAIGTSN